MLILSQKRINKAIIYVFLFFFMYSPCFIAEKGYFFSPKFWGWFILIPLLYTISQIKKNTKASIMSYYYKYCRLIIICLLYYFMIHIILVSEISLTTTRMIQNFYPIVSILNLSAITYLMKKMNYSYVEGIGVIIHLATLQGIICILMILIPNFKNVANTLFINSSSFNEGDYILGTRIYGISSDYTYGLPIVHGLLSGISMYIGLKYQKKYIFYSFLILVSVILNGRTGLIIATITLLLAIFFNMNIEKINPKTVMVIFAIPIMLYTMFSFLQTHLPYVYRFVCQLFKELKNRTGTIDYLTKRNLFFPKGINILVGEGHTVFGEEATKHGYLASDIGFVNDLFMGGIIYILIRYYAVFKLIFYKVNKKNKMDKFIIAAISITWIIANYKGQATVNTMIIAILQFLFLCKVFLLREEEENE